VENDTGSWPLFTGIEVQPNLHSPTLTYTILQYLCRY